MPAPPTSTGITRFPLVQGSLDLDRDEVICVGDACREQLRPARSDDRENYVGTADLRIEHLDEVVPRLDVAFHIHEQIAGRELVLKPLVQPLGIAGIVTAPGN